MYSEVRYVAKHCNRLKLTRYSYTVRVIFLYSHIQIIFYALKRKFRFPSHQLQKKVVNSPGHNQPEIMPSPYYPFMSLFFFPLASSALEKKKKKKTPDGRLGHNHFWILDDVINNGFCCGLRGNSFTTLI